MFSVLPKPGYLAVFCTLFFTAAGAVQAADDADKKPAAEGEVKNNRADTVDGSQSTWSGQLNFNYSGSSVNHPFAKEAPNPANQVPAPLAQLQGTMGVRYRINASTTAGFATGLTTVTPLQGQKHTTIANPLVDIANTIKLGHWHQYADLSLMRFTDFQSHIQYGYEWNPSLSEELAYYFDSGLTLGVQGLANYTSFASGEYAGEPYDRSQQLEIQIVGGPFGEYAINDIYSVRTVVNIEQDHTRELSNRNRYHYPKVTQTLGLSAQVTKSFWLYAYVLAVPYNGGSVTAKNTTMGLQTVINLF